MIIDITNRKQYKLIEKMIIFVSKYCSINTNFVNSFFTFFDQIFIEFIRSQINYRINTIVDIFFNDFIKYF